MGANIAEELLDCIELAWVFKNHVFDEVSGGECIDIFYFHIK